MTRAEMEAKREEIQSDLDAAKQAQVDFWDALSDLEFELGCVELDSTEDLEHVTVDDLIKTHADKQRRKA